VNYSNAGQVRPGSAKFDNPSICTMFDTSLWVDPATNRRVATQEPYARRTLPFRFSDVRLPGYQKWHASVSKMFRITERVRLITALRL